MKNRTPWIDVVKGLGMFLVVLGHISKDEMAVDWIYSFHMPLFFFLSGYLLYYKNTIITQSTRPTLPFNYFSLLKKKTFSLLLPFVVLRVILLLYWLVVERHFRPLDLGPIWFLVVLYFVEIIYIPLVVRNKRWLSLITILCSFTIFYLLRNLVSGSNHSIYTELVGWCCRVVNSGIWFVLGYEYLCIIEKCARLKKGTDINTRVALLLILTCLIVNVAGAMYNGNISIFSNRMNNPFLYVCTGIAGITAVLLTSKHLVKSNKVIEWIGYNSIIVLAFHEPVKRVCLKSLDYVGVNADSIHNGLIYSILLSGGVIFIIYIINFILKWMKPRLGQFGYYILIFIK